MKRGCSGIEGRALWRKGRISGESEQKGKNSDFDESLVLHAADS